MSTPGPAPKTLTRFPCFVTIVATMPNQTKRLAVGSDGVSSHVIAEAAQILAAGGLVAFPTETVYGIGANVDHPQAMARLSELKSRPPDKPFSLHIADLEQLADIVDPVPAPGRKLIDAFWPGPLTLVFGNRADKSVGVRLPASPVAREFLRRSGVRVVAPSANPAGQPPASTADQVFELFDGRIDALLDAGPAPLQQSSTVVRVWAKGWQVLRDGIISESMIRRALRCSVLFICTGNSCRSPIAEALCRRILARRLNVREADLSALGYDIASAGTATAGGGQASESALAAARDVGLDISGHRTQSLTAELLSKADRVYVMSSRHAEAAAALLQGDTDKIELLDPDGAGIEDPIGYPLPQFARVVRRMERCIEKRTEDL